MSIDVSKNYFLINFRAQKIAPKPTGQTRVKKLEAHRRMMLQKQLTGDCWDTIDSVKQSKGGPAPPPPPIGPPNRMNSRRPPSPAPSGSSIDSSTAIPHPRSPPAPVQPLGYRGHMEFRGIGERRPSVSTLHTEKTEQYECKY